MYIQWFIKWGSLFSKSVFLEIIITRIRIWEITTGKTNQTSVICKNDNTTPKGCHARFKFSNIKKVCILSTYSVINYPVRFWCFWKLTWEVSLLYWIWKRCLSKIRIKRLIQQFWQYSKHFLWDIYSLRKINLFLETFLNCSQMEAKILGQNFLTTLHFWQKWC